VVACKIKKKTSLAFVDRTSKKNFFSSLPWHACDSVKILLHVTTSATGIKKNCNQQLIFTTLAKLFFSEIEHAGKYSWGKAVAANHSVRWKLNKLLKLFNISCNHGLKSFAGFPKSFTCNHDLISLARVVKLCSCKNLLFLF